MNNTQECKNIIDDTVRLYKECGLIYTNFTQETENSDYYAYQYSVNNKKVLFRIAKKTPTKVGWFVAFYKRNCCNIIEPYSYKDDIDILVITIVDHKSVGQFVFKKQILLEHNIISTDSIEGKRAMRVYAPCDITDNRQAQATQRWQSKTFFSFDAHRDANFYDFVRALYV